MIPHWLFMLELGRLRADIYADVMVQRAVIATHARRNNRLFIYSQEAL